MKPAKVTRSNTAQSKAAKGQEPTKPATAIPKMKTSKRANGKALQTSIARMPGVDQLRVLSVIADSERPKKVAPRLGRMEKDIGGEIKRFRVAVHKEEGNTLGSEQLLDLALQAVATGRGEAEPHAAPIWNAAQKSAFSALRNQPLEIQRGQLKAMLLFEKSRIAREVPEAAADALYSILIGGEPCSRHASQLVDLYNQAQTKIKEANHDREAIHRSLSEDFLKLGVSEILKPAIAAEHPGNLTKQRKVLDKIVKDGTLYQNILDCCSGLRKFQRKGEALHPDTLAIVDKLESLNKAIEKYAPPAEPDTEAMALEDGLMNLLASRLPAETQAEWTSLAKDVGSEDDSDDVASDVETLLRARLTTTDQLTARLTSDAEVFEGLQILWGGAPVYSLRFALDLSEMLLVTDTPESLLQEVESKLLERLGPAKLGIYALHANNAVGDRSGLDSRAQLVLDSVTRILSAPKKDSSAARDHKALDKISMGRPQNPEVSPVETSAQRRELLRKLDYAMRPPTRPHQAMLEFLETKKGQALVQEAAQRPANPMPAIVKPSKKIPPPLIRQAKKSNLLPGGRLQPKPPAPPVKVEPISVTAPANPPAEAPKRTLKRRFVRQP